MPRLPRVEYAGAYYHVMSRGNNHQDVFLDDQDRRRFISRLGKCCSRFEVKVHAFCLMNNHFHLFLRTPRPNLSSAMHWLIGVYTQGFNYFHRRDGHLFRGRYRAVPVEDESHWRYLSAYIHLNPVRSGYVQQPDEWEWSSFNDYVGPHNRFEWLDPEPVLALLGPTQKSRQSMYRQSLTSLSENPNGFWDEYRKASVLTADSAGEPAVRTHPVVLTTKPANPISIAALSIEEEVRKFAESRGIAAAQIYEGTHNPLRPAVYRHLVYNCGFSGAAVARHFGVSRMAVSFGIRGQT